MRVRRWRRSYSRTRPCRRLPPPSHRMAVPRPAPCARLAARGCYPRRRSMVWRQGQHRTKLQWGVAVAVAEACGCMLSLRAAHPRTAHAAHRLTGVGPRTRSTAAAATVATAATSGTVDTVTTNTATSGATSMTGTTTRQPVVLRQVEGMAAGAWAWLLWFPWLWVFTFALPPPMIRCRSPTSTISQLSATPSIQRLRSAPV